MDLRLHFCIRYLPHSNLFITAYEPLTSFAKPPNYIACKQFFVQNSTSLTWVADEDLNFSTIGQQDTFPRVVVQVDIHNSFFFRESDAMEATLVKHTFCVSPWIKACLSANLISFRKCCFLGLTPEIVE